MVARLPVQDLVRSRKLYAEKLDFKLRKIPRRTALRHPL